MENENMQETRKKCCICQEVKLLTSFTIDKKKKDSHGSRCVACNKAYLATYYRNHAKEITNKTIQWQQNNPQKVNAKNRAWRKAHPGYGKYMKDRWIANNPEKILNQSRREAPRRKIWKQANPDKVRASNQRHKANKLGAAINDFTAAQWCEMQVAFDHRCAYCGKRAKGHLTQDHLTPLSKGGNHTLSNIVPACRSCNSKKYTGPPLKPVQPLLL